MVIIFNEMCTTLVVITGGDSDSKLKENHYYQNKRYNYILSMEIGDKECYP